MNRDRSKGDCLNIEGVPIEEVIEVGKLMVDAHERNEMLWDAIDEVKDKFPQMKTDTLMVLWVGVNCKDRQ